ncbi:MAG TPA: hypothetical protein VFB07_01500 [Vicinamibacterales bacterium]|nr:hypothetical protein [Vicinamibacterales bacterium]
MVDALRRASRWVRRDGCVIDIHPTAQVPTIEAGGRVVGRVEVPDGPARHGAADRALRQVVDEGRLVETVSHAFDFYTWGDSFEELREHIEENWRDARIAVDGAAPAGRCRAVERVRIAKLVVAGG